MTALLVRCLLATSTMARASGLSLGELRVRVAWVSETCFALGRYFLLGPLASEAMFGRVTPGRRPGKTNRRRALLSAWPARCQHELRSRSPAKALLCGRRSYVPLSGVCCVATAVSGSTRGAPQLELLMAQQQQAAENPGSGGLRLSNSEPLAHALI